MPLPKGFKFLRCPACRYKGVSLRGSQMDGDWWGCRACDWSCFDSGEDSVDVKRRHDLAALNPTANVWVSDLSVTAVQRILNGYDT